MASEESGSMSNTDMDRELERINSVTLEVLEGVAGCLKAHPPAGERISKESWDAVMFQFDTAEMTHQHAVSSLARFVGRLSSGLQRHHAKAAALHRLQTSIDGVVVALRGMVKD
jgi:hypothetical protein